MSSPTSAQVSQDKNVARRASASGRSQFLKWLRKVHGWVGLWGAVLGLLFGITGILQNHRSVLKIGTPAPVRSTIQVDLPSPPPATAAAMAEWLGNTLHLEKVRPNIRRERAETVIWSGHEVAQPEHWQIRFGAPHYAVAADYWKGASTIKIERIDNGLLAIMENLHRSNGVGIAWILLADSIAGAMVLLSVTGVILWSELNKRRLIGFTIFAASIAAMLAVVGATM